MKFLQYGFALFICVLVFSGSAHQAFASGACSSNGTGTSWNTAADWTGTCTGTGGKPGTGDDVTIAAGDPITLDVATPSLNSLHVDSTLDTGGSNYALNVNGTSGTLYIDSGGTLNANASTVTIGGYFYDQAGTFNAGTSTVDFTLNGSTTMIYGSPTFYNLMFAPTLTSGPAVYDTNDLPITVSNNLTFNPSGAAQPLDATMNNSIAVAGTVSIGGSGSATTVLDTGGDAISAGSVSITSAGTLTAHASTITLTGTSGTLFADSGTFNAGTSTVNSSGNGSATINSGSPTFYNLTSSGTGTKTVGAAISFASGGTLSVTNGTFNSNTLINTSSGATVSVSGSGTILVPTSFGVEYPFGTVTLGTGSTVNYNESGAQTIESSHTYYNLTTSGSFSKIMNGPTTILGTLTTSGGTFDTSSSGNYTLNVGYIVVGGGSALAVNASTVNITGNSGTLFTYSGGFSPGTSTINLTGNGSATFISAPLTVCNVVSSGTGTKSLGGEILTFNNSCNLSVTNGTFDPGGTVYGGTGSVLSVTNATINVSLATFPGTYSFSSVTLGAGSTVSYSAGGSQVIDHTKAYVNLATGGSGTKSLNGATTATGTLSIGGSSGFTTTGSNYALNVGYISFSSGTFTMNNSTIDLTGTSGTLYTQTGGGIGSGSPTINLTGNGDATVNSGTLSTCNFISSGSGTKTLGGNVDMSSGCTFSVTSGTLNTGTNVVASSGATLTVTTATLGIGASTFGGNFSGFTTRTLNTGSTVNYNGAGTQTVDNGLAYYGLSITGGPREVDFPASGTTTVTNAFNANGSAGNLLSLFSTSTGTPWTILSTGTTSVSYVAVKDGACGVGSVVASTANLTDGGDNGSCWVAPIVVATATPVVNHGTAAVAVIVPSALGSGSLDFILNNGSSTTNNSLVTLNLNADPKTVTGYAVSLDPNFVNGGIQPYVAGVPATFQLPNTAGTYTVYVEYFSPTGSRSAAISHTVSYNGNGSPAVVAPQTGSTGPLSSTFTHTLARGATGVDVTALQKLLVADGELVMPAGADFGYFGSATKNAIEAFQVKYGIVSAGGPGYGMFGPKTRAKANSIQ